MCLRMQTPQGAAIICGVKQRYCVHCHRASNFLCDWKVKGGSGTCDREICSACALEVAPNKHLCREHQIAWQEWKRQHGPHDAERLVRQQPQQMTLLEFQFAEHHDEG